MSGKRGQFASFPLLLQTSNSPLMLFLRSPHFIGILDSRGIGMGEEREAALCVQ